MQDFFAASRPKRVLGVIAGSLQVSPAGSRTPGAKMSRGKCVAVAAFVLLGGCSWFSDEPSEPPAPVTIDSPAVGTSGEVPAVTGVPDQPATPEVSVLDNAPQGLGSDSASAQYGDELTMPSIQAPRPVPPPPPPPVEVPPAADAQTPPADGAPAEAPAAETPTAETPAPEGAVPAEPAPAEPAPEAPAPQSRLDQAPAPTAAAC